MLQSVEPGVAAISSRWSSPARVRIIVGRSGAISRSPRMAPIAAARRRARCPARGECAGRLFAVVDHRHDHAERAQVERVPDDEGVVAGRRARAAQHRQGLDGLQHGRHRRRVDDAVLLVDDHVVRARGEPRPRR